MTINKTDMEIWINIKPERRRQKAAEKCKKGAYSNIVLPLYLL
jgi:hypothetical protein